MESTDTSEDKIKLKTKKFVPNKDKFKKKFRKSNQEDAKMTVNFVKKPMGPKHIHELYNNMNSPPKKPNAKKQKVELIEPVGRSKQERKYLNGTTCHECEEYYKGKNLPEDKLKEILNNCSRHRGKSSPQLSPKSFWDTDFPDHPIRTTEESD